MGADGFFLYDWLKDFVLSVEWSRARSLHTGAWMAGGTLFAVVVLGWAVALGQLWDRVFNPNVPPEKTGWLKALGLAVLVILPFGLASAAAVAVIVGKKNWRLSAVFIQLLSVPIFLALGWFSWAGSPWPWVAEDIWVNGTFGIAFALLQLWTTLKLLREAWGEAPKDVAWWPPLALWMQTLYLFNVALAVFL